MSVWGIFIIITNWFVSCYVTSLHLFHLSLYSTFIPDLFAPPTDHLSDMTESKASH